MSGKKNRKKTLPLSLNNKKKRRINVEEEEDEQEGLEDISTTSYIGRGLSAFLKGKREQLDEKKKKVGGSKKNTVEIVLFHYKEVRYLPVREGWESFVKETITGSNYIYGLTNDYTRLNNLFSDHLFHLYNKAPWFFDSMACLDTTVSSDGMDGGYQILQCFLMFLQEDKVIVTEKKLKARQKKLTDAMTDTYKLRRLMKQWVIDETDYFLGRDVMTELDRGPLTQAHDWALFKPLLVKALPDQFDPAYQGEGLVNCFATPKNSPQPQLDVKHLLVFAKATKTRIVLLLHFRSNNWLMEENDDSFVCHDFDWRYSDTPDYKYSSSIPVFGDEFDFFRTAIIMRAPGCAGTDGDHIYWYQNRIEPILTMWLPQSYDPTKEERKTAPRDLVVVPRNVHEVTTEPATVNVGAVTEANEEAENGGETLQNDFEEEETAAPAPRDQVVAQNVHEATTEPAAGVNVGAVTETNEEADPGENLQYDVDEEEQKEEAGIKGKRNAWSRDGPNNKYEGSTLWCLIDWLKSDRNYARWKMKEDGKKGAMQEKLAGDINKAGKDLIPPRNRKGKALGEKIVRLEHRMQTAVKVVDSQLRKPKGLRGDKLMARIRKEFHYFEELYPAMKDALGLRDIFAEMRGEQMQIPSAAATVSVEGVAGGDVQLANLSNLSSNQPFNGSTLEKLEIEGKAIDIYAKRQEQRLKDYQSYRDLKEMMDHDFIANKFPTLVFFFKKGDFEEKKYRHYVELYNAAVTKSGIYEPMSM